MQERKIIELNCSKDIDELDSNIFNDKFTLTSSLTARELEQVRNLIPALKADLQRLQDHNEKHDDGFGKWLFNHLINLDKDYRIDALLKQIKYLCIDLYCDENINKRNYLSKVLNWFDKHAGVNHSINPYRHLFCSSKLTSKKNNDVSSHIQKFSV